MKHYKLLKDLPTFKAGEIFLLNNDGDLVQDRSDPLESVTVYSAQTLKKFPNILTDWFEELEERPKTVWDLEEYDKYYYIFGLSAAVEKDTWVDTSVDRIRRDVGDVFLTEEEAKKEVARRRAKQILLRDAKGFKPDIYNLDQVRSYVAYDPATCEIYTNRERFDDYSHEIIFKSHKDAEASIKTHEKEWKIYLGVEE